MRLIAVPTAVCTIAVLGVHASCSSQTETPDPAVIMTGPAPAMTTAEPLPEPAVGQALRVGGADVAPVAAEQATYKEDGSSFTRYRSGRHVVDTPLPDGYPPPTPPGAIELKRYPVVRRAEVSRKDDPDGALFGMVGGKNAGFWPLFRHIQKRNIAMTAPVETDMPGSDDSADDAWRMAFLYRSPDLGPEGQAERGVVVKDAPEVTVLALGVSGKSGQSAADQSLKSLRAWLAAHPDWKQAGPARVLNYNDPFTNPNWSEVQIVVERQ
ncbi:MAG: heme-binding protein [Phycisphaerales bacterium]